MNIVETIARETADHGAKTAIVDGDRSITYARLLEQVDGLAAILKTRELGPGQRIAFHCGDGIDYVIGSLALLACGVAVVPVADSITEAEVRETLEKIDVHGTLLHFRIKRSADMPTAEHLTDIFYWQSRQATGTSDANCREMGAAFIRFSSGTTGESKGVVLSHRSILDRTDAANQGLNITHDDVILWVLAMSYHFVVSILLFLRKGSTIVVANQFFPFSLLTAANRNAITFIYASPVHYHLLGLSAAVPSASLAKVRLAISTSMKMPSEVSKAFRTKFGFIPAEAYGIIEIGLPFINVQPTDDSINSVGKALPDYQLRIHQADATGIGQVFIKGKGMFDAYFSPWRTRESCTDDGWFHTGDLGRLDESGRLFILGRSKTVLICAGMKVFPEEVEQVIDTMAGVTESMVLGREHPQFGQVPIGGVVIAKGTDAAMLLSDLRTFCCQRLSAFKVPVEFVQTDALPRTPSGKIARAKSLV